MTLHADDPDVHMTFPVTAASGNLSFTPVVRVEGFDDIEAEWLGSPGASRELKVPLYGLPAGYMLNMRLIVPNDVDLELGYALLESGEPGVFPSNNVDHGSVSGTLAIGAGSHELDLSGDLTVTISGLGDVTLWVHGTGQTITVAGEIFTIDGDEIVLVVRSPRGVRSAHLVGSGGGSTGTVTATTPTSDDTANTYTIPAKTGVIYRVGGTPVAAGVYGVGNVSTTVIVTAVAAEGYTLVGTSSWPLTFTEVTGWATVATDSFSGADGSSVSNRALSGGTYTWAVDAAGDGPATIQSNYAVYNPAESYLPGGAAYRLEPAPPAVTGIIGWAIEFDYAATTSVSFTGSINLRFRYQSDLYGAQNGYVALNVNNSGVSVGLGGTANDDTSMQGALTQVGGTTVPLSGRLRIEIQGRAIRYFFNDVLTFTSTLPGDLLAVQPWRWQIVNTGPGLMKVKNMALETA